MCIWVPVKDYEGLYEVSSEGDVCRLRKDGTRKPPLKWHIKENGYAQVSLSKEHKASKFYVHRLVCTAFHENPENKREVNHIDYDRLNNRADNVEWSTPKENNLHSLHKRVSKATLVSPKGERLEVVNISAFAHALGLHQSHLNDVVNGKRRSCGGWRLADE